MRDNTTGNYVDDLAGHDPDGLEALFDETRPIAPTLSADAAARIFDEAYCAANAESSKGLVSLTSTPARIVLSAVLCAASVAGLLLLRSLAAVRHTSVDRTELASNQAKRVDPNAVTERSRSNVAAPVNRDTYDSYIATAMNTVHHVIAIAWKEPPVSDIGMRSFAIFTPSYATSYRSGLRNRDNEESSLLVCVVEEKPNPTESSVKPPVGDTQDMIQPIQGIEPDSRRRRRSDVFVRPEIDGI